MSPYVELSPSTGSTTTPGGADTQVQFNNAGAFGGSANMTWNNATSMMTISQLTITSASLNIAATGVIQSATGFSSSGVPAQFGSATAGNIVALRPNGLGSTTAQLLISTTAVTASTPVVLPADPTTALQATTKQYVDARTNTNVVINGDFRVNQGGYVSAAVLAAGAYGHDQWKAGAAGGDYSFTQLASSTQITIASGKSLIQPIENVNVAGGSYVLSWTGTAQARYGVNTLTPSGTYAASPVLIAGQTAGTVMSVEFNAGTLGTVKLERGSIATPFVMRPYDQELLTCQRYYFKKINNNNDVIGTLQAYAATSAFGKAFDLPVTMRSNPATAMSNILDYNLTRADATANTVTSGSFDFMSPTAIGTSSLTASSIILTPGDATLLKFKNAGAWISADARL